MRSSPDPAYRRALTVTPRPVPCSCRAAGPAHREVRLMAALEEPGTIDGAKLEAFVFRAVDEIGATLNAALVVMGDKLGLYRALAGAGGATPVRPPRRADGGGRHGP